MAPERMIRSFFLCLHAAGLLMLGAVTPLAAQPALTALPPARLQAVADEAYKAKDWTLGATAYERLSATARFSGAKAVAAYNAACCQALGGQTAAAMQSLEEAAKLGYDNAKHIEADADLTSLHALPRYQALLQQLAARPGPPTDPEQVQLVTSDIDLFWQAYDHAQRDPKHAAEIYDREYFDRGTVGLQDYYTTKIQSTEHFVKNQHDLPNFYRAIRPNTLRVASMTPQIRAGFRKLKELYPAATFPNIYFVIGRYNSAGTASSHGMLIGTDQLAGAPDTPLGELGLWARNGLGSLETLPYVVAHEHIHYLQKDGPDRSLLRGAIDEGMCDFLAELTTGHNPNARIHPYGHAHEKELWADFQKEMTSEEWGNWIGNGGQETAKKPADLGYYLGYRICQAYYEQAADKKQAVHDILNITDYPAFLAKSGYERKLAAR